MEENYSQTMNMKNPIHSSDHKLSSYKKVHSREIENNYISVHFLFSAWENKHVILLLSAKDINKPIEFIYDSLEDYQRILLS